MKSELLQILKSRGFIHQATDMDALDNQFATQKVTAYIGFDATANSLHVGSLVQIMMLRWLQKCGHRPIVLMGGGTSKIGDPSGKDEARTLITQEAIQANIDGISRVFKKFLEFGSGANQAVMINNDDWLKGLNYINFLRDYGRHFSVNRMLSFDSVKLRLEREQPLSFLEFNYMILQAYDFLELNRLHGCTLQMGGSDQWGNIVNGVDLTRRVIGKEVYGLTSPLITTSSGAKMGKTANGAIWLNEDRLSAYDYWQFWRNTEDADVGRYLRLFTEIDLGEIEKLEQLPGSEINHAKKVLADAATALAHGVEALQPIHETITRLFEQKNSGGDLSGLPSFEVTKAELESGLSVLDMFIRLGLADSKGDARRLIQGNGAKINDVAVSDPMQMLTIDDLTVDGMIKLSAGKKRHGVIKVS